MQKRTSRGREDDTLNLPLLAPLEALKDSAVLAVHGQEANPPFLCFLDEDLSCHYEGLFIGKGNIYACPHCFQGRDQPGGPDNSRNHHIHLGRRGYNLGTVLPPQYLCLAPTQEPSQMRDFIFFPDTHPVRRKLQNLSSEPLKVAPRHQTTNLEMVWKAPNHLERAYPDRPCRAQDCNGFHG